MRHRCWLFAHLLSSAFVYERPRSARDCLITFLLPPLRMLLFAPFFHLYFFTDSFDLTPRWAPAFHRRLIQSQEHVYANRLFFDCECFLLSESISSLGLEKIKKNRTNEAHVFAAAHTHSSAHGKHTEYTRPRDEATHGCKRCSHRVPGLRNNWILRDWGNTMMISFGFLKNFYFMHRSPSFPFLSAVALCCSALPEGELTSCMSQ